MGVVGWHMSLLATGVLTGGTSINTSILTPPLDDASDELVFRNESGSTFDWSGRAACCWGGVVAFNAMRLYSITRAHFGRFLCMSQHST